MKEIAIHQRAFSSPDDVHGFLKDTLGLPEHYGGNLSALNDCLGDLDAPTRILVQRGGSDPDLDRWFDKLCGVLGRNALENPALSVVIKNGS